MKYRAEIDGLRALAVVPVILFHAGFEFFSGGFVGVDVFFVISGYLITTILIDDIENNRFSLLNFYERRARRILPALFFVMLACIPFAWMWMLPSQMKDFSQSLVAVGLFASNILFWRENGYFDAAAEEKPLLHTWSLAVEEQYYLLFPIFLFLAWRFGKNKVFWTIVVLAVISLGLSEWGWRNSPVANFYLAPTRAWELFAGSIAAFIVHKRGVQPNNILSLIGLAAVLFSIFVYDESTPFPSVYALVPVVGVVLLVLFAGKETIAAKLLGMRAVVGIGLISYSAYLWHQPLFAFTRIKLLDEPSTVFMILLSAMSIVIGFISWKFVEQPFRSKNNKLKHRSKIFLISGLSIFFFMSVGLLGHTDLFVPKSAVLFNKFGDGAYGGKDYKWIEKIKSPKYLLVGDSHAKQYYGALKLKYSDVSMYAEPACISLPNLVNQYQSQTIERKNCITLYKKYLTYLNENKEIKTIFFSHRWGKKLFDLNSLNLLGKVEESEEAIQLLLKNLRALFLLVPEDKKIIIIGNVPSAYVASNNLKKGYLVCMFKNGEESCPKYYPKEHREGQLINLLLKSLASEIKNVEFFDPAQALCDGVKCHILKDEKIIYSDHAHLTNYGAKLVVDEL